MKSFLSYILYLALLCSPIVYSEAYGEQAKQPILLIGDSLSAGYGVELQGAWPQLLQKKLASAAPNYQLINDSISGDTSSNGLRRLSKALKQYRPQIVIIELGGNDGLRGMPPKQLERNLARMIESSQQAQARVLLTGIQIPPNYGEDYARAIAAIYPRLASKYHIALVPFLMHGVAGNDELMQDDGLHPNDKGQPQVFANVWLHLEALLKN